MNLVIQQRSETPIYEQIYNQIVLQILSGKLSEHESLPSIRKIARELEISVIPVKAAYEMLERDGYMYTVPAKGCFTADIKSQLQNKKLELAKNSISKTLEYCKQLGLSQDEVHKLIDILY